MQDQPDLLAAAFRAAQPRRQVTRHGGVFRPELRLEHCKVEPRSPEARTILAGRIEFIALIDQQLHGHSHAVPDSASVPRWRALSVALQLTSRTVHLGVGRSISTRTVKLPDHSKPMADGGSLD